MEAVQIPAVRSLALHCDPQRDPVILAVVDKELVAAAGLADAWGIRLLVAVAVADRVVEPLSLQICHCCVSRLPQVLWSALSPHVQEALDLRP